MYMNAAIQQRERERERERCRTETEKYEMSRCILQQKKICLNAKYLQISTPVTSDCHPFSHISMTSVTEQS